MVRGATKCDWKGALKTSAVEKVYRDEKERIE
jgi:hypothetical protein